MKKLILTFLLLASTVYAEDYVDGHLFTENEVSQWDGIQNPSVSPTNSGRLYYDSILDNFKVSVNGGSYNGISLYGHTHPIYTGAHSEYSTTAQLGDVANLLGNHQHNQSYPSISQFQLLSQIATTNTHSVATAAAAGFAPILSGIGTEFLNGTGAYSTPAGGDSDHQHPFYAPEADFTTHQHDQSYPGKTQFQQLYSIATTNQHTNYVPYVGATSDVNLATNSLTTSQHVSAGTMTANSYYAPDTNGGATLGTNGLGFSSLWFKDSASAFELAFQATNTGMAGDQTLTFDVGNYSPTLTFSPGNGNPTVADWFNQNVKTTASPTFVTLNATNVIGTNLYGTLANNQHSESYPSKAQFQQLYSIATTNTHAVATTSAAGFAPILSNVATEFLNGTGAYSTPAGGSSGVDSFETLASPQALQGIEQLRHNVASYQNYGNVIVDGLQDLTGIGGVHQLTYTGSSTYQYALTAGGFDSFTKLVSHFDGTDGATAYTAETGQVFTFFGNAQVDTAQTKFGVSSLLLDGTGDYVTLPDSNDWDFGTGDFTVDFWMRWNDTSGTQTLYEIGTYTSSGILFYYSAGALNSYINNVASATYTITPNPNQWYHIALVRASGTAKIYVDGVGGTGVANSSNITGSTDGVMIGALRTGGPGNYTNGWIDEWHIEKGKAEWTSNFTPPTSAWAPSSIASGFIHSIAYPMPTVPTHLGVSVKMDDVFPANNQHQYLKVDISRDGGTTFTDCHPITQIGTSGYYRADQETITAQPSGQNVVAKVTLANATARTLKGYSIYGE